MEYTQRYLYYNDPITFLYVYTYKNQIKKQKLPT